LRINCLRGLKSAPKGGLRILLPYAQTTIAIVEVERPAVVTKACSGRHETCAADSLKNGNGVTRRPPWLHQRGDVVPEMLRRLEAWMCEAA
jgi:hypothetical protein